jgi:hypothetical protein
MLVEAVLMNAGCGVSANCFLGEIGKNRAIIPGPTFAWGAGQALAMGTKCDEGGLFANLNMGKTWNKT